MNRKLRMGMIGGGLGSFIGNVHRMGAELDGHIELVCGAFSQDPEKSLESGRTYFIPEDRTYGTFQEMITKENELPENDRMDFVSIVTPNHVHFEPTKLALNNGFPVILDKPLCHTWDEAMELKQLLEQVDLPFGLTHTYAAYPMVKQARVMVREGVIGQVTKINVEYPQGWLTEALEADNQKQASWRTDPAKTGISNCFGDIGTHAAQMAEYVSGLKIVKVLSQLSSVLSERTLDDDANALLEFEGGVRGLLSASQISSGEENGLKIRVYGTKGGLEWRHDDHNSLKHIRHDGATTLLRAGTNNAYLSEEALAHCRVPAGHPEGYIEAFANIYRNFAMELNRHLNGVDYDCECYDFPGIEDGVRGMAHIKAMVDSTKKGNVWTQVI